MNAKLKFKIFLMFGVALLLLSSCKNLIQENPVDNIDTPVVIGRPVSSENEYISISGSITSAMEGAIPSEYYVTDDNETENRSAFPSNPTTIYYKVYAEDISEGVKLENVDGVVSGSSFTISLKKRSWLIHVEGYADAEKTTYIVEGLQAIDLTARPDLTNFQIKATGVQDITKNGVVSLPISIESGSTIHYAEIFWGDVGGDNYLYKQELSYSSGVTTATFTMNQTPGAGVVPGSYSVKFNFYDSAASRKLLYSFTQRINVYSNLTTDTWVGKAPYINSGNITITNTMATYGSKKEFYIKSSAGENGTGGFFTPFNKIKNALDIVTAINDGSTVYKLILLSDFNAASSDIFEDATLGKSYVNIASDSTLNLLITSLNGEYSINANGETTDSRTIFVGENVNLTLENVTVSGGKITNKNGGGIYVDTDGKLILNNKAVVKSNTINVTDGATYNGNGIYCVGSIEINAGSIITENITPITVPIHGGGVTFTNPNGTFVMNGGVISKNQANHGGGLVLYRGQTVEVKNGQFTENSCYITGGAIWANSSQNIEIKDCVFTSNSSRNGGAIFNKGNLEITDCIFESNSANLSNSLGGNGGAIGIWQGTVQISGDKTKFLNNTSDMNGGAIYCSTGADYGNAVLNLSAGYFKGNTIKTASGKGNGVYVSDYKDETKSPTATFNLSGSLKMEDDQIIYLEKTTGATPQDQKFINLGELTGSPTEQKFNLDLESYVDGTVILKEAVAGGSNVASFYKRFTLANSNFEITNEGKLKDLTIAGVTEDLDNLYDDATVINEIPEAGKTYTVSSVEDLVYLQTLVDNNYTLGSVTFKLGSDITLTGTWTGIGYYDTTTPSGCKVFSGTFDGGNHTIKNLKLSGSYKGFFTCVSNAVIKNLTIEGDCSVSGAKYMGNFVAGVQNGSLLIDNCVNKVNLKTGTYLGGFVGSTSTTTTDITIINSVNYGAITSSTATSYIGGFIGKPSGNTSVTIKNCANYGAIGTRASLAGFVGYKDTGSGEITISNCINVGAITSSASPAGAFSCNSDAIVGNSYYLDGSAPSATNGTDAETVKTFDSNGNFAAGEQSLGATNVLDALNNGISGILSTDGYTYNPWFIGDSGFPEFVAGTPVTYPEDTPGDFDRLSVTEVVALTQISSLASIPSAGDKLRIENVDDIKKLIEFAQSDTLEDVSFYLEDNVDAQDLDGGSWTPLGTADKPFKGYFDGMGKTIKLNNLPGNESVALIAYAENAKVRNVNVKGTVTGVAATKYIAGIVGHSKGSLLVENCTASYGNMTSMGAECVAGIVAYAETQTDDDLVIIRNCYNSLGVQGSVAATDSPMAGIAGHISGNKGKVYIHNCGNTGTLGTADYLGGILGWSENTSTWVENCVNTYELKVSDPTKGSVIGYVPDTNIGVIKNCFGVYYQNGQSQVYGTAGGVSGDFTSVGSYSVAASKATITADGTSLVDKFNAWCEANGPLYKQWTEDASGVPAFTE